MAKKKYTYYVGVMTNGGVKFVTDIMWSTKCAKWEAGKDALDVPENVADDITFGLLMNFIYAFTVKVPSGIKFHNAECEEV